VAADLRVHVVLHDLQRQFAAWLGTPTRARGYPPRAGQHALLVEVAPGLAIHRIADLALKAVPAVEPSILFVERQFGVLGVHADRLEDVQAASDAIRAGLGQEAGETSQGAGETSGGHPHGLVPRVLYVDVIDDIGDTHAVIVNRTREASMLLPGRSLLVHEVTPALFAAVAANEAERVAPDTTLVDVSIIGSAGRLYLSGSPDGVRRAAGAIDVALSGVEGRAHD
jgi:hypothetical protein